jgi:integrase
MASVFKRKRDRQRKGSSWYIAYADENGVRRTIKGCPDKAASEGMARKLESEAELRRRGVIDPRSDAYSTHEAKPLVDHLADFRTALVAAGRTSRHTQMTFSRAAKMVELAGVKRISHLSLSKALNALASLRAEGLGMETCNHYVRAVKAFSRWLWKDGRAREHALAHLSTSNPEADLRRRRRALTPEEATRLVQAAESGPTVMGMTGPDRGMVYRLAMGTGFRASELGSLTRESFRLDSDPPLVVCEAGYTKNGRLAEQPVSDSLAALLRPWVASRASGHPVFDMPGHTAEMIRVDLATAGIPFETSAGRCDFHSLRAVYISNLVASGASVKTCQVLARHSTPSLTIGVYAKASLHDIRGAVGALPDLSTTPPEARSMAATGTESGSALTAQGQRAGDVSCRDLTVVGGRDDVCNDSSPTFSMNRNSLKMTALDGPCRDLTAPDGDDCERRDSNPHAFRHRNLNPTRLPVPPLSRACGRTELRRPPPQLFLRLATPRAGVLGETAVILLTLPRAVYHGLADCRLVVLPGRLVTVTPHDRLGRVLGEPGIDQGQAAEQEARPLRRHDLAHQLARLAQAPIRQLWPFFS